MIPKRLRERYGLVSGRAVTIIPLPDGVSIVAELAERRFVRNGPLLSIDTGSGVAPLSDFDVDRIRDAQLAGKLP